MPATNHGPLIDVGDGTLISPPPASPPPALPPAPPPPVTVPAPAPPPTPPQTPIVPPGQAFIDTGDVNAPGVLIPAPPATGDTGTTVPPDGAPPSGDDTSLDIGDDPEAGDEPTADDFDYWQAEQDATASGALELFSVGHPAPGTLIGFPYEGTHAVAFNRTGGSDNWQSENAVDVWLYPGTHITAVANGVISPGGYGYGLSAAGGRFAGYRLHLVTDDGKVFFYTHMAALEVLQGRRVQKGDVIGDSGIANGVPHLHFAARPPYDPRAFYKLAFTLSGHTSVGTSPTTGGPPVPPSAEKTATAAWNDAMAWYAGGTPDHTTGPPGFAAAFTKLRSSLPTARRQTLWPFKS